MRALQARPLTSLLLLLGLGSASAAANAAASEVRQPTVYHAAPAARTAHLELASGERVTPPRPAGAELANAAALGEHGWVVTALRAREIVVLTGDVTAATALPAPPGST